jgi:hypothetical protein
MTIEPMTVGELLTRLQVYYNAGMYSGDDVEAWSDEYEKRDPLFLGCLFVAIRRIHSKTFKTLPDVAIAAKATEDAYNLFDQVQKAITPKAIEYDDTISESERQQVAEGLKELYSKLLRGKSIS